MSTKAKTGFDHEQKFLAPYAIFSAQSRGRKHHEPAVSPDRLCFQRDRDRVIHSKSWRRLKHKTQVFIALEGDHYRDRLTHSLEVAQIARGLARRLGLNEDLAEVIALAHDLGHTPFGHSGEETLNGLLLPFGEVFEHNRQSRRVVEDLERVYPDFSGLNLSFEVIDGLIKHQSGYDQTDLQIRVYPSLEAQIVNLADEIAYSTHDLDDGLRSGVLELTVVGTLQLWREAAETLRSRYGFSPDPREFSQLYTGQIIRALCDDIYRQTLENITRFQIDSLAAVYRCPHYLASFTPSTLTALSELREFLRTQLYFSDFVRGRMAEGKEIITALFRNYLRKPDLLPASVQATISPSRQLIPVLRDYIAGMTDNFARHAVSEM